MPQRSQREPGGSVARAGGQIARTLLQPAAGIAREAALSAFHVATYPLGLLPGAAPEPGFRPRHLGERSLLAHDPEAAWSPIVLVHGYVHNRSAFSVMSRSLRRSGFQFIHGLNYNPLTASVEELAGRLAEAVDSALKVSGADTCQIVGHSMGGIIARYYAQELAPPGTVDTVVTLGSPHRGTHAARIGLGPAVAELRPGSALLRRLEESARPSSTRWIAFHSDLDLTILPASSAKLVHPALRATNIRVRNTGHLSLLLSSEVTGGVLQYLRDRNLGRDEPVLRALPAAADASA